MKSEILNALPIIIASILTTISIVITIQRSIRNRKNKLENTVKELLDGRVWDIPVELQCQKCKKTSNINFDLGMYEFTCKDCGQINRIFINFLTTIDNDGEH